MEAIAAPIRKVVSITPAMVAIVLLSLPAMPLLAAAVGEAITIDPTEGPVGTKVTVHGAGWTPGYGVPINIGMNTLATGRPDANGRFTTALTIPQLETGTVTIDAIIGNGGAVSVPFRVTATDAPDRPRSGSRGPDLQPTAITVGGSQRPVVDHPIHFDSGIANTGDRDAPVFNLKWLVDGKDVGAYGSHGGIPAGTSVLDGNSQFDWTFVEAGRHTVTVRVDVDNHVAESNEKNNSRSVTIDILSATPACYPPELAISEGELAVLSDVFNEGIEPLAEALKEGRFKIVPKAVGAYNVAKVLHCALQLGIFDSYLSGLSPHGTPPSIALDALSVGVGGKTTASGRGWIPGRPVLVSSKTSGVRIAASTLANDKGRVRVELKVPQNVRPGTVIDLLFSQDVPSNRPGVNVGTNVVPAFLAVS